MRRALPLAALLPLLVACPELEASTSPPTFLDSELACVGGEAVLSVIVGGDNPVTTLRITTPEGEDWYPIEDTPGLWRASESADCEAEWELQVTATNAWGIQSETTLYYPEAEPETDALDPAFGPTTGGTEVWIPGDDLAGTTQVLFGGVEALLTEARDEGVWVETPAHDAGAVDVELSIQDQSLTLPEAFTYHDDASGLMHGIARPTLFLYEPTWFSIGSPYASIAYGPFLQTDMVLHTAVPAEDTYLGAMPAEGSCTWGSWDYTSVATSSYALMELDDGTQYVLDPGSGTTYNLVLQQVEPLDWAATELDLLLPNGDSIIPAQTLSDAIYVPPIPVTSHDWAVANSVPRGEDLTLTWEAGDWDGVEYRVHAVTSGFSTLDSTYCVAAGSDEELVIAWDAMTATFDESQMAGWVVLMRFYEDRMTPFAHDGAELWSRGFIEMWSWHPLVDE